MGKWIHTVPEVHICDSPRSSELNGIVPGSIWQCDCGKMFKLIKIEGNTASWHIVGDGWESLADVPAEIEIVYSRTGAKIVRSKNRWIALEGASFNKYQPYGIRIEGSEKAGPFRTKDVD